MKPALYLYLSLFLLVACIALAETPEPPLADLSGYYSVAGRMPDGTTYKGVAVISRPREAYLVVWTTGAGASIAGVGQRNGNTLSVAWDIDKKILGVTVFTVREKKLTGRWVSMPGPGVVSDETLVWLKELSEEE